MSLDFSGVCVVMMKGNNENKRLELSLDRGRLGRVKRDVLADKLYSGRYQYIYAFFSAGSQEEHISEELEADYSREP